MKFVVTNDQRYYPVVKHFASIEEARVDAEAQASMVIRYTSQEDLAEDPVTITVSSVVDYVTIGGKPKKD